MSVAEVDDEIVEAGAEILWVLEQDPLGGPGTAESCLSFMADFAGADQGWCLGDAETEPEPGTFDDSPFSVGRGFDIIVPRESMVIAFTTNHGTPSGNENLDGQALLEEVRRIASEL